MNWTKELPNESGDYVYCMLFPCGCCVGELGHCEVFPTKEGQSDDRIDLGNGYTIFSRMCEGFNPNGYFWCKIELPYYEE
jgi:hypothetical protein